MGHNLCGFILQEASVMSMQTPKHVRYAHGGLHLTGIEVNLNVTYIEIPVIFITSAVCGHCSTQVI